MNYWTVLQTFLCCLRPVQSDSHVPFFDAASCPHSNVDCSIVPIRIPIRPIGGLRLLFRFVLFSFSSHLHLTVEGCCVQVDCWVIQNPQPRYQSLASVCLPENQILMDPTPHETKDQCECDRILIQKDKASKRTGVRRSDNQLKAEEASAHELRTSDDIRRQPRRRQRHPTINQRFDVDVLWKRELWLIITWFVADERDQRSAEKERLSGLFHGRRRPIVERSRRGWRWRLALMRWAWEERGHFFAKSAIVWALVNCQINIGRSYVY